MKEAYCSYEISELLKKKGFDEPCRSYYVDNIDYISVSHSDEELTDLEMGVWETLRPTHQMACAWIREKGYHIYTFKGVDSWVYEVQSLNDDWTYHLGGFENHDDAIGAALKYTLKNLI